LSSLQWEEEGYQVSDLLISGWKLLKNLIGGSNVSSNIGDLPSSKALWSKKQTAKWKVLG